MNIVLVAAIGEQRQLGLNNELLWQLPGDLPRFKEMTMGAPIIMGRKTFDSIGKPLPGRTNIILTRNADFKVEGAKIATSVDEALSIAQQKQPKNVFIIGGGEIYQLFLSKANVLELTLVDDSPKADAFFPEYLEHSENSFQETSRQSKQTNSLRYHYVRYERSGQHSQHSTSG